MLDALANLFSLLMDPLHALTGNWWAAIALFTAVMKIALLPLSLWCQMNSLKMVAMMPEVNRIKARRFGDAEAIGEEQARLNRERGYHPMLSLVPLAIQILVLFGLVQLIHRITDGGSEGTELLGLVPAETGGVLWLMPLLAGLSAVALGLAQNRINPLQREQSRREQLFTNGVSVAISFVLGVWVAAGMAFYWICSNLMSICVQLVCNLVVRPERYVDYDDLAASKVELATLEAVGEENSLPWWRPNPLARREKADYKRFFNTVGKHLVVYSERSGFWKYMGGAIEWLLDHSDARVHYVTSDPNDQVFDIARERPRLIPYYIGEKRLITLMMKMDADVVLMTLQDLDNFYIKRSYVRHDINYVYMFHHPTSTHLVCREDAYDNYSTILCVGPHQAREIRAAEKLRDLPEKRLVKVGYDLLDRQITEYAKRGRPSHECPVVLIAPSWQEDNILDLCADETIGPLVEAGYRVVVRPHPEYTKRYRPRWEALQARWADNDGVFFEQDFSSSDSILDADVLVTDWSSVFCEFSLVTLRPCIFIDTPMKATNPNWGRLGIEPTDISLRREVGRAVAVEELEQLPGIIDEMLAHPEEWRDRIESVRSKTVFNLGHGGEAAGRYLLDAILEAQEQRGGKDLAKSCADGLTDGEDAEEGAEEDMGEDAIVPDWDLLNTDFETPDSVPEETDDSSADAAADEPAGESEPKHLKEAV